MELKLKKTDKTPFNSRPVERAYWQDRKELWECFKNVTKCNVNGKVKYCL